MGHFLKKKADSSSVYESFTDLSFSCILLFTLMIMTLALKLSQESAQKILPNRFANRGGQPFMNIHYEYSERDGFYILLDNQYPLTYQQFRKILCNLDRREEDKNPALIFYSSLGKDFNARCAKEGGACIKLVANKFGITYLQLSDWLLNRHGDLAGIIEKLLRDQNSDLVKKCNEHKKKYTTTTIGNFEREGFTGIKVETTFVVRKKVGRPFLWFTADLGAEKIVLGPSDDPLKLSPDEFKKIIEYFRGGDGFFIEYRDPKDLNNKRPAQPPRWIIDKILVPSGYSNLVISDDFREVDNMATQSKKIKKKN